MNIWTYSFIICMEIHYSPLSPFPNIRAGDSIILQLIQSLLLTLQNQTPQSPHTRFYFQGMSDLLGVKGITLQAETSIKAQRQPPQEQDSREVCRSQGWRTTTFIRLWLRRIFCHLQIRRGNQQVSVCRLFHTFDIYTSSCTLNNDLIVFPTSYWKIPIQKNYLLLCSF